MTEKFKILANYIKDMSSETPDVETFIFVKDNISKYQLNIDITSKALKDKLIDVDDFKKLISKRLQVISDTKKEDAVKESVPVKKTKRKIKLVKAVSSGPCIFGLTI